MIFPLVMVSLLRLWKILRTGTLALLTHPHLSFPLLFSTWQSPYVTEAGLEPVILLPKLPMVGNTNPGHNAYLQNPPSRNGHFKLYPVVPGFLVIVCMLVSPQLTQLLEPEVQIPPSDCCLPVSPAPLVIFKGQLCSHFYLPWPACFFTDSSWLFSVSSISP